MTSSDVGPAVPWRDLTADVRDPQLRALYNHLEALIGSVRQGLVDDLWEQIPSLVDESGYVPALAVGGTVALNPQYSTLELIQSVVAVVPAGASGIVQLGNTALPVSAGPTIIGGVRKVLGPSDTRALTIAGASGAAALWLTGVQLPTFGVMGP